MLFQGTGFGQTSCIAHYHRTFGVPGAVEQPAKRAAKEPRSIYCRLPERRAIVAGDCFMWGGPDGGQGVGARAPRAANELVEALRTA